MIDINSSRPRSIQNSSIHLLVFSPILNGGWSAKFKAGQNGGYGVNDAADNDEEVGPAGTSLTCSCCSEYDDPNQHYKHCCTHKHNS